VGLGQQAYVNGVLSEEMIQFLFRPRTSLAFQQASRKALIP
jgi:hypothetical protein